MPSSFTFRLTLNMMPLFGTNLDRDDDIAFAALYSKFGGVDGKGGEKSSSSRPGGFGCSEAKCRLNGSGKGLL